MTSTPPAATPYRQIRAHFDEEHVTVYQAYKETIAKAAVARRDLRASPEFRPGRMTWVKPSWCWMMYRAGYSYKDARQSRVLALRMRHADFVGLLERGVLSTHAVPAATTAAPKEGAAGGAGDEGAPEGGTKAKAEVRVQWDPERDARLQVLPYRSIQVGISGALSARWAAEWIVSIEDVTEKARELKKVLDERPGITDEELAALGLLPEERPYPVPESVLRRLEMS